MSLLMFVGGMLAALPIAYLGDAVMAALRRNA